jgi:hypothetical protein
MSILDAQCLFSDAQALTATAVSTNSYDSSSDRDLGTGEPLAVVVGFDVALAGTTPTIAVSIQTDDNSAFSSPTTIATGVTLSAAAAGAKVVLPVPADATVERYLRVNYTLGGTTPTATVTAYLQPLSMVQGNGLFASGFAVS